MFDTFFGFLKYPNLVFWAAIDLTIILSVLSYLTRGAITCLTAMAKKFPVLEMTVGGGVLSVCIVTLVRFIYAKAREGKHAGIKVNKDV